MSIFARPSTWKLMKIILGLAVLTALLVACQPAPTPAPTTVPPTAVPTQPPEPTEPPPPTETTLPTLTPLPDQTEFIAAWSGSPHGNTYDLGKGPNTYCSRCHSPQNWDPAAKPDAAPNCVTCKFATDPELRMAKTMDFVEEEDWHGIYCDTCHIMENGVVTEGNAWFNPLTKEYDEVRTPNEVCTKCHLTSQGVSATGGRGVTHEIYLGGSAHKNWAGVLTTERRPEYCTDCHDPHTQIPKTCAECHEDVLTSDTHINGTIEQHANVSCMACHDATGADVGPHPDEAMDGVWVPILTEVGRSGPTTSAIISHSPQWEVSCDRCHFEGNAWELTVLTADGEIPEPPEPPAATATP
ncbi:MAG TPA: multiheme c-type cytochrome [Anaerolineales bacterium]|nr:multiheme c-type cytochrome [Anaerolineales bacterium]